MLTLDTTSQLRYRTLSERHDTHIFTCALRVTWAWYQSIRAFSRGGVTLEMVMTIVLSTTCDDLLRTNCNNTGDSQTFVQHHIVGILSKTCLFDEIHTKEGVFSHYSRVVVTQTNSLRYLLLLCYVFVALCYQVKPD